MFTFLSPVIFWMAGFALIPIIIHFLGRGRLKKKDFPSLLLIRKKLVQATQKQKLKNILLMIIRTLIILSLLAALFNPIYKGTAFPNAVQSKSLLIINNGAWANYIYKNKPLQHHQLEVRNFLAGFKNQIELIYHLPHQKQTSHWRFGNYSNTIKQLEAKLETGEHFAQCIIPYFNSNEINSHQNYLNDLVKKYPNTQFILLNYEKALEKLSYSKSHKITTENDKPIVISNLNINSAVKNEKASLYLNKELIKEFVLPTDGENVFSFDIPRPPLRDIQGYYSINRLKDFSTYYFNYPKSQLVSILHIGSRLVSLPSLGNNNFSRKIISLDKVKEDNDLEDLDSYKSIFMMNVNIQNEIHLFKLLNYVKRGGNLVIGLGEKSNISSINRHLLIPARMGSIESLEKNKIGKLNINSENLSLDFLKVVGNKITSNINQHYSWKASSHVDTILSKGKKIVLGQAKIEKGRLALWTTDMNNIQWSFLGASSFVPMYHQNIIQSKSEGTSESLQIKSDSIFSHELDTENNSTPKVLDPQGLEFPSVKSKYGLLEIGPFSKLGHYSLVGQKDTLLFSVNLNFDNFDKGASDNWKNDFNGKIMTPEKLFSQMQSAVVPLWKWFIFLALLLFFAEIILQRLYSKL